MDKKIQQIIIDIGFFIQTSEKLPTITEIKLKSPISGCKKTSGHCRRYFRRNTYRIDVYLTTERYFPDPNGNFIDKITKEKFRKAFIGEDRKIERILKDLAHELAHTKYWRHNKEHSEYTEVLYEKIIAEYQKRTQNIEMVCMVKQ